MKRRHRRLLNLFALSLLAVAVYLNMYHVDDGNTPGNNMRAVVKNTRQLSTAAAPVAGKSATKELHKN